MESITENTKISMALLILVLAGLNYIVGVSFKTDANAQAVQELREDQKVMREVASDVRIIRADVERIKKKIGE